ncbi:AzlD domain-containing protein [Acetobacteraceae bacterium ESL0709]|nr:AzlD domain-containing protein [Acetobacteraceae bacterium ESL0697]MDF7678329.1 AzlD domain-containing protein [Acetobacteraceae bacterium ESL0709]
MSSHLLTVIMICSLVSFLLRAVPILTLANRNFPPLVQNWLSFIPSTIIAAIIASEVSHHLQNRTDALTMVSATIISFIVCFISRSLFLTVIAGMGIYLAAWYFL